MYEIRYKDRSHEEDDTVQGLTLPMAENQRENMELSATYFEPVCTLSAAIPRSVAYQEMKMHCRMQNGSIPYISEPKRHLSIKFPNKATNKDHSTFTSEESNHPPKWNLDYLELLSWSQFFVNII